LTNISFPPNLKEKEVDPLKKKIGTLMEEGLIYKAKRVALSQNRPLNAVLEEALSHFLQNETEKVKEKNIALSSQGVMRLPKNILRKIMEEEGYHEV
jgi:Holliday junction resolvasome RuvABC ATP-dependent DNA helicase subunit